MSRFIELHLLNGNKYTVNVDAIIAYEPIPEGTCLRMGNGKAYADVNESYEEVKALFDGDTNAGCKSVKDIDVPNKITNDELQTVVLNEREKANCNRILCKDCKWRGEIYCGYTMLADYLNKKLKGETK